MLEEGYYDNCVLKEAVTTTSQSGSPMMVLTFDVGSGTTRSVRLMLDDTKQGKDGKTCMERSGEVLDRIGFDGNFDDPKFSESLYNDGISLRCKHSEYQGKPKEEWSVGFAYQKADSSSLQNLSRNYRARFGSSPKPAGAANKPAPTRTPPTHTPPAKKVESDDMTDTSGVTDMDTAFKYVMKHNPGLTDDEWQVKVDKQAKKVKRKEDAFTAEDWQAVASDCVVPF